MEFGYSSYMITLACVIGVWLACPTAEGKCRGDWKAYHGCLGGNGKRSDPKALPGPDGEYSSGGGQEVSGTFERMLLDLARAAAAESRSEASRPREDINLPPAPESKRYSRDMDLDNLLQTMASRMSRNFRRRR